MTGWGLRRAISLDAVLFVCALGVFLATRLIGLTSFPIYFFADEAIPTVTAADLFHRGFRDVDGTFLPTYLESGGHHSLSLLSVLEQLPGWAVFGFSAVATRGTSVAVATLGTAAVALILRDVFRVQFWWAGVLLLAITPAWFLHSRTAFETVLAVSLYAWFLYFYLRYIDGPRRYLHLALVFAALSFYSYRAIQPVIVLTFALFLASNFRRHLQSRRHLLVAAILVVVLALPFARFELAHGGEAGQRLRALDSYWVRDEPLTWKLRELTRQYSRSVSPSYWYSSGQRADLVRHRMRGYGHILWLTAPFSLLGAAICARRIRRPSHRALLLAAVAAPVGGAIAGVGITRVLVFVVPASVLTGLGLAALLSPLARRLRYGAVAVGLFLVLAGAGFTMLGDALRNGPTWYRDYGLYGMQYGAPHVFREIESYLRTTPQADVRLSPSWANATDVLVRFFASETTRWRLDSIESFRDQRLELPPNTVFVMTPDEYATAVADARFSHVRVVHTLAYPDGTVGFYFVRLQYSPGASAVFAAERRARRELVAEPTAIDGKPLVVGHTAFDLGSLENLFDGDETSLVRTSEANPAVVELRFAKPRPIKTIRVTTGSMRLALTARLTTASAGAPVTYSRRYLDLAPDPTVTVELPRRVHTRTLRLVIRNVDADERGSVHIREIALAP